VSDEWEDKGTGHVRCVFINKREGPCIVFKSEVNDSEILRSKISPEDRYHKQETLIVWNEPVDSTSDEGVDLALSFQYQIGCTEVWDEICELQQHLLNPGFDLDQLLKYQESELPSAKNFTLPATTMGNIDEIFSVLNEHVTPPEKQHLANLMIKDQYISKLVDLWKRVQDMESEEYYLKMYHIFKDIVLLNNVTLLEQVVASNHVIDIMSALEHDPDHHIDSVKHSEFLLNQVKYKSIIPFNDINLENKIHQTYRLQYLKDVALARTLDEATFATINTLICVNNIQIISEVSGKEDLLLELLEKFKSLKIDSDQMKDHLLFVAEMCDLMKNLDPKRKAAYYQFIMKNDILSILQKTIVSTTTNIRMTSVQILLHISEHDSSLLRSHLLNQTDTSFLSLLIKRTDVDTETGVKILLFDVLKHLCDSANLDGMNLTFVSLFYQKLAPMLFSPLNRPLPKIHTEEEAVLKYHLCEFLGLLLQNHTQCVSSFILNSSTVKNIINILSCREKWLVLAAIRFFRVFITIENPQFRNFIFSENFFEPIINLYLTNGGKYNLIESSILELFEWIIKKNFKVIIKHVMDKFYSRIKENSTLYPTFKHMKDIYDKNDIDHIIPSFPVESPLDKTSQARQRARQSFIDEREEEDWFSTDSDSELSTTDRDLTPKKRQLSEDHESSVNNNNNNKENSHKKKKKNVKPIEKT
jgi:protein phosphatase-4 regulatory subunit 3